MQELDIKTYRNRHSLKSKVARLAWNITWLALARWVPEHFCVFNRWRILLLRLFGARIGKGCGVKAGCEVWQPWKLSLDDYVTLGEHVICYAVDQITIGDQTAVNREAFLYCAGHDITSPIMGLTYTPITIGANVGIAARAIVMSGRTVGEGLLSWQMRL